MTGSAGSANSTTAYLQWQVALDLLELDLERATHVGAERDGSEVGMSGDLPGGELPQVSFAIPETLQDRARDLLARQRELSEILPSRLHQTGQQHRATAQFSGPHRSAVYVDVTA